VECGQAGDEGGNKKEKVEEVEEEGRGKSPALQRLSISLHAVVLEQRSNVSEEAAAAESLGQVFRTRVFPAAYSKERPLVG
jgi:hypothetical protein